MGSGVYHAQFFRLDLRLLDHPEFLEFMRTPAFAAYFQLVRYVWRGKRPHPIEKVNKLRAEGKLVAAVPREVLATKLGINQPTHLSRLLSDLAEEDLIKRHRTGRESVYEVGRWEDRSFEKDGSYVEETFYLYQRYGPDSRPQILVDEEGEAEADGMPEAADVHATRTSDVRKNARRKNDVRTGRTSDVRATRTSDVRKNARRDGGGGGNGADVRATRTSDVRATRTSILNRKEKEEIYLSSSDDLRRGERGEVRHDATSEAQQRAVAQVAEVLAELRRPLPDRETLGQWLEACGNDAALAEVCLRRLARQGHLSHKPDEYVFKCLERDGREAARLRAGGSGSEAESEVEDDVYVVS